MGNYSNKSSLEEITERFDRNVDLYSNLETGQSTAIDAVFSMELIMDSIMAYSPNIKTVLDVGCGAGNYTLKLLSRKNPLDCTLLDLSGPMLARAKERITKVNKGRNQFVQGDIRTACGLTPFAGRQRLGNGLLQIIPLVKTGRQLMDIRFYYPGDPHCSAASL